MAFEYDAQCMCMYVGMYIGVMKTCNIYHLKLFKNTNHSYNLNISHSFPFKLNSDR